MPSPGGASLPVRLAPNTSAILGHRRGPPEACAERTGVQDAGLSRPRTQAGRIPRRRPENQRSAHLDAGQGRLQARALLPQPMGCPPWMPQEFGCSTTPRGRLDLERNEVSLLGERRRSRNPVLSAGTSWQHLAPTARLRRRLPKTPSHDCGFPGGSRVFRPPP